MFRPLSLLLFILCFATNYTRAQTPDVAWHKSLGSFYGDYAKTIQPTSDGGFILAGYAEGNGGDVTGNHGGQNMNNDIWVVKLTNSGNIQWQKSLGGIGFETGTDIKQTADGGYIVSGTSGTKDCNITDNHGGLDFILIKLTSGGDIVWRKSYGGSQNEYAYGIDLTQDGGYIVAGLTESNNGDVSDNHGNRDFWVIKTDSQGALLWQKSLGGTADEEAYSVRATPDGGCVVAGYTSSTNGDVTANHGNRDVWITKLDNAGLLQWQKCLGGTGFEKAWSIQLTTDGGYIAAGFSSSNNGDVSGNHHAIVPSDDFWVMKLSSTGSLQWQKCYGGNFSEQAYYIQLTPDGGYVVSGEAQSKDGDITCNAGEGDMWIIKINSTGQLQWQRSLGGSGTDIAFCTQPLSDGSYIVAGSTCSRNIADWHITPASNNTCADFFVTKLTAPQLIPPLPSVKIHTAKICTGSRSTLTASALNVGMSETYQWVRNGTVVGTNSPSYSASDFINNEKVMCKVTSNGPCDNISVQVSDTFAISINNNVLRPTINITADNITVCNCTKITFKATVAGGGNLPLYQWKVNGNSIDNSGAEFITKTLKQGDLVRCIYTDSVGCIEGDSALSNTIQIGAATGQIPSVSIQTSTDTICSGSSARFTATTTNAGTNPSFQWKVNNLPAGTNSRILDLPLVANNDAIACTVTTDPAFNCVTTTAATSNVIKMVVTNKVTPSITISASHNMICSGSLVSFTAIAVNSGKNPTFQWQVNGVKAGLNSAQFSGNLFSNADVVTCIITVDSLFDCASQSSASSNAIILTIKNEPNPGVTVTASTNDVCQGDNISFKASVQGAGTSPSYQWVVNNNPVSNSNTPTFRSSTLSNGDAVFCKVTPGSDACSLTTVPSNSIVAVINPLLVLKISPADTAVNEGAQIQLRAEATGNLLSYTWSPVNQLVNSQTLAPFTLPLSSDVTYSLVVTSDKGCQSSAEAEVKIGRELYMPSAFTPNGDGKNDVFKIPRGVSIKLKEFSIFNRWGQKIFRTTDAYKGWDGRLNGTMQPQGNYIWFIRLTDVNGNAKTYKGNILVVY